MSKYLPTRFGARSPSRKRQNTMRDLRNHLVQGQRTFAVKGHIVNISVFAGHTVSVITANSAVIV